MSRKYAMKATASLVLLLVATVLAGCSSLVHGSQVEELVTPRANGVLYGPVDSGYGTAVAVRDDVAVIGAFLEGQHRTGAAYIYRLIAGEWLLDSRLESSDPVPDGFFGGSVAVGDGWIAVSARNEGAIYLYRDTPSGWQLAERVKPEGSLANNRFGAGLVVAGGHAAFSANTSRGHGQPPAESVFVYNLDGAGVSLWHVLEARGQQSDALFGETLALDNEVLVVGAGNFKPTPGGSGAVYIYALSEGGPVLVKELVAPAGLEAHGFGASLSISSTLLAVGAPGQDYGGYRSGPVVLFERDGSTWTVLTSLRPTMITDSDHFGTDLVLLGDDLLVSGHTDNDLRAGSAYTLHFKRAGGGWVQSDQPLVSTDTNGARFSSLASDGQTVLIGVPAEGGTARVASFTVAQPSR